MTWCMWWFTIPLEKWVHKPCSLNEWDDHTWLLVWEQYCPAMHADSSLPTTLLIMSKALAVHSKVCIKCSIPDLAGVCLMFQFFLNHWFCKCVGNNNTPHLAHCALFGHYQHSCTQRYHLSLYLLVISWWQTFQTFAYFSDYFVGKIKYMSMIQKELATES
jgi:hypothetical protein